MRQFPKITLGLVLFTLIGFSFFTFGFKQPDLIVVSIGPQKEMVKAMVGELYSVAQLVPDGADPKTFKLSKREEILLSNAKLYIHLGVFPFEREVEQAKKDNKRAYRKLNLVSVIDSLKLLTYRDTTTLFDPLLTDSLSHDSSPLFSEEDPNVEKWKNQVDPYYWLSPGRMITQTHKAAEGIAEIDYRYYDVVMLNRDKYTKKLIALDRELQKNVGGNEFIPFMVFLPEMGYFAHDYHVKQVFVRNNFISYTDEAISRVIREARYTGIKAVIILPNRYGYVANSVAKEIGAVAIEFNPYREDYIENLRQFSRALKLAYQN